MALMFEILKVNILPIFIVIFIGFLLEKKFNLEVNTLSKINFYIMIPVYTFVSLYESDIKLNMFIAFIFVVSFLIVNFFIGKIICKLFKVSKDKSAPFQNSILFYNSGNMGIPLITLVFTNAPFIIDGKTPYLSVALTIQVIVMVVQNIFLNTVGFINISSSNTTFKNSLKRLFSMPTIYVIPLIILIKFLNINVSTMVFWPSFQYIKEAMISIALITLGIQLGKVKFNFKDNLVYLSVFIRLLLGPMIALLLLKLLGITGTMMQSLFIAMTMPTAVNVALISVECDSGQEFASQAVMLSTLFSPLTITLMIGFMIKFLT